MHDAMVYGIAAFLICFTLGTFFLTRIRTDIFPEEYEFQLDGFWYICGILFLGAVVSFAVFPAQFDMVKNYTYADFALPAVLAAIIYCGYLLDVSLLTNILILISSLIMSYLQPDSFILFPTLTPWQNKLAVVAILFTITKGMSLMNGLGAIASMQFLTVMVVAVALSVFGILPQLLGVTALAYAGTMLAFAFLSWPPEKLVISDGGFSAIGFIMACFMLNAAVEYTESSMFIAISYLVTEIGIVLYYRFICNQKQERWFISTSYYRISNNGEYEDAVVRGILKIMVIDVVLAITQIAAQEQLAMPIFAVAVNVWFLSILSGDTKPEELLSLTGMGKKVVKKIISKKDTEKTKKKNKSRKK